MGMLSNIVKWVSFMIAMFFGILAFVGIFTTSFPEKALADFTWGQIFLAVFILSGMFSLIWLMRKIAKLESAIPSIKIRSLVSNHIAILEVYNKGEQARFTATCKILKGSYVNRVHILIWENNVGTAPIDGRCGIGKILIAQQGTIDTNPLL